MELEVAKRPRELVPGVPFRRRRAQERVARHLLRAVGQRHHRAMGAGHAAAAGDAWLAEGVVEGGEGGEIGLGVGGGEEDGEDGGVFDAQAEAEAAEGEGSGGGGYG